ncbi:MAG: hypothetical protein S4CHLAM102_09680 [Chlamydiia bacterium]|nr:hypothetical protein [Chlamydiia bacterium]
MVFTAEFHMSNGQVVTHQTAPLTPQGCQNFTITLQTHLLFDSDGFLRAGGQLLNKREIDWIKMSHKIPTGNPPLQEAAYRDLTNLLLSVTVRGFFLKIFAGVGLYFTVSSCISRMVQKGGG